MQQSLSHHLYKFTNHKAEGYAHDYQKKRNFAVR